MEVWTVLKTMAMAVGKLLPDWWDLHVYGGIGLVSYGVGSMHPPAGIIVLGLGLCALGIWFVDRVGGA